MLRTTLRRVAFSAQPVNRIITPTSILAHQRCLSTSSILKNSHAHHPAASTEPEEVYPEEGFTSPLWRNSVLLVLASVLVYRLSPTTFFPAEGSNEPHAITNYLAHQMPEKELYRERNLGHLKLAKQAADDQLLFQEAERPRVKRMRYLGTFDQASPNGIVIGSQADLSDLKIKSEKDDFGVATSSASHDEDDE